MLGNIMRRVVVFGTFDIFHPGHESFLKQAKNLGEWLLVVVARDTHVKNAKSRDPDLNETERARIVRKNTLADKVILGSKKHNYFQTLRTYKIDTIALGYDQKPTLIELKRTLKRHRLSKVAIVRLKAYNPTKYKSSKLRNAK